VNLLTNFPSNFEPTTQQVDLIQQIDRAFASGKKFVVCCAPTGSGKSFLSKTLANTSSKPSSEFVRLIESYDAFKQDQFGDFTHKSACEEEPSFGTFALTITKTLQDQYRDLFNDTSVLKGKSNYLCTVDSKFNVDVAPCIYLTDLKDTCIANNKCPYYSARSNMLINKFAALNYSMFMSLPDHVKRRQYIVCDEASELEDELVKRFSRELNYKVLKKLGIDPITVPVANYSKFGTWLSGTFSDVLANNIHDVQARLKRKKNDTLLADRQRYTLLKNLHISIQTTIDTWNECEYLIERHDESITLKPLRVDNLAKHIFDFADHVLLMSATIIDHASFAKTLGIKDYEYIEVDSTFDPKNAPILCNNKVKLNHKNMRENLPRLSRQIADICKHHSNVKGVIHTHTHEITEYLKSVLIGPRFIFREPGTNNEQIIRQHLESQENTILVSPSLTLGVDLKDDLARFQILVKAAYLPLGDERIKRLFKEDTNWYQNKMLNNLIQACGRGVRSRTDHCVTYVLDGCITDAVLRCKDKLPKYFLKRFV
jgi:ATP-dependent DNA helicase DinG